MTAISPIQTDTDVSPDTFREAMSRVGSAVHIVTSAGPAGVAGFTATAFASVSVEPPLVLICVNTGGRSNAIIRENGTFCVNTLAADHADLASIFARRGAEDDDRFDNVTTVDAPSGAPRLTDALVSLDCRVTKATEAGSHTVFIGAVEDIVLNEPGSALMYRNRDYKSL